MTIVISKHVEDSERFDKEQVEHVNLSFTILNCRLKFLEFLSSNVSLTPP
jgi:hypothetical protein